MIQYESIEYEELDGKITINWQEWFRLEDLASLPRKKEIQMYVANFKLVGKIIECEIELSCIDFIDSFKIENCEFIKPLRIYSIRVFSNFEVILNNFNQFTLDHSVILNKFIMHGNKMGFNSINAFNIFYGYFYFYSNEGQSFNLSHNKFAGAISFLNNIINKLNLGLIEFIDPITSYDELDYHKNQTISFKTYFKNIKKYKVDWISFRRSLCNIKGYYLTNYDYFTGKNFEWLEEQAYFQACATDKLGLSTHSILIGYYLKKYFTIIIAVIGLVIAILSYI